MRPISLPVWDLLRNIKLRKLHVVDSLHDDQKVQVTISVFCLNVQSLRNKIMPVAAILHSKAFVFLALTATCIGINTDQFITNELVPAVYELNHIPSRNGKRAAGIGMLNKSGLTVTISKSDTNETCTRF